MQNAYKKFADRSSQCLWDSNGNYPVSIYPSYVILTEAEIHNHHNHLHLKVHYYSQNTFMHMIRFHLHNISPHNSGIPQGSVRSSLALYILHSLHGIYHPHLWLQPPSMWWGYPKFISRLVFCTRDAEGHMELLTENPPRYIIGTSFPT